MRPSNETHETVRDSPQTVPNGHQPSHDHQEDRPEQSSTVAANRVTVPEAAEILGTTTDAVRSRMRRGKLKREEGEDGTVYVVLEGYLSHNHDSRDASRTVEDRWKTGDTTVGDGPQTVEDGPLVESLRDQVSYLRDQLDKEREANRENRRLLAAALERIPAIEAGDERDAPVTATEGAGKGDVPLEEQESSERRSWLHRFFFGP